MVHYNIPFKIRRGPSLDPGFIPLAAFRRTLRAYTKIPMGIVAERDDGQRFTLDTEIIGDSSTADCDKSYIERMLKLILWTVGASRVTVYGKPTVADFIRQQYSPEGKRAFDTEFMEVIYNRKFEVFAEEYNDFTELPTILDRPSPTARELNGCRIGLDADNAELTVSAIRDGETVFSDKMMWHPKITADISYHMDVLRSALSSAASRLPRVEGIGVATPGVFIANQAKMAPIFRFVQPGDQDLNIFRKLAAELGDIPLTVTDTGNVAALSGAMSCNDTPVLGISLGAGLSCGYIGPDGGMTDRLNRIAFAPLDLNREAHGDEWSGDIGCATGYLTRDAAFRLAVMAGIELPEGEPSDKLRHLQSLVEKGNSEARLVFEDIGIYLGHALALYRDIYDAGYVALSGSLVRGRCGVIIANEASLVIKEDYPKLKPYKLFLAEKDEQPLAPSVAAAALPCIE